MSASRILRSVLLIAALVMAGSAGTTASDSRAGLGSASPAPASPPPGIAASPSPERGPGLWLRGPFGRVAAGPVEAPAAAAPLGSPLDAFVRGAPLELDIGDTSLVGELSVSVVARLVTDPSTAETLSASFTRFAGPESPGLYAIVASLEDEAGATSEHAWLVDVPDRQPPADGLYDIPAPAVLLESATGSVAGVLGDGCYVYLCVEAGPAPPLMTLAPLELEKGEVPLVRLGDASAIVAWEGRLTPVGDTEGRTREASGALTDTTEVAVALAGLALPGPGTWRLDLEVTLDRERGWLRTTHRLVTE